jgi:hypothetical protein
MKYSVITISDKRSNNVAQIQDVMGSPPEKIKFCNMREPGDRSYFRKKFPQFKFNKFMENPLYYSDPNRRFGAMGCWMSHLSCWSHMIDNNIDEMIVFEDDCLFNKELFQKTTNVVQENSTKELLMFGQWSEMCYIKLSAAHKLFDSALDKGYTRCPVDEYMFNMIKDKDVDGKFGINAVKQLVNVYPSDMKFSIFEDTDA